mgnify:CR=1 FL=1
MNLILPIYSIMLLSLLIIVYFSKKRVQSQETKLYSVLLIISFFNVVFNIIGIGGLLHDIVNYAKHEILHLGIAHVKNKLCAATAGNGCTVGMAYNPFGMFFIKFALGIGHLGFNPYTPLKATAGCRLFQGRHTIGELAGICYPVAQSAIVHRTLVLVTKPSVVHNKHIHAKLFCILCELNKLVCVKIKVTTFPAIDKQRTFFRTE